MKYEIGNEYLTVEISSKGGELLSVRDKNGEEYLWQGDVATWKEQAPNLFPYIGRMTNGSYTYRGQEYHMKIHGFLKYVEMELVKQEADLLVLKLENLAETEAQYPFRFVLEIQYRVMESSLEVTYHVKNRDSQIMYFGIGGHPGFQVPMEEGLTFEDYFLDFGEPSEPMRVDFSEDCFVTEKDSRFVLREGRYLDLRHDLFDDDAIVLYEMPHQVSIRSSKSSRSVQVEFPQMPYVGFWHWPKAEVPYVCIEPWSSLPSRKDRVEDLEQQENLLSLNPEAEYENTWKITIHNEKEA